MTGKIIKGGLLGGLVMFMWTAVSWTKLPWHMQTLSTLTDEAAVLRAVKRAAPQTGLYVVPNANPWNPAATPAEHKAVAERAVAAIKEGPSGLFMIRTEGFDPMDPRMMIRGYLNQAAVAALFAWILLAAGVAGYAKRVSIVFVAGAAGALMSHLPLWNWWGFPAGYTGVMLAETAIGWLLAGFAIAWVAAPGKSGRKR